MKLTDISSVALRPGWQVGESIAMELDVLANAIQGTFLIGNMPEEIEAGFHGVPVEWRTEWQGFWGAPQGGLESIVEMAAFIAGELYNSNYEVVTIAIREMSQAEALRRLAFHFREDIATIEDINLEPAHLIQTVARSMAQYYQSLGFETRPSQVFIRRIETNLERVLRIFLGGDLHTRFWLWMDRVYYQVYGPWRETRRKYISMSVGRAIKFLGNEQSQSQAPCLDWLPKQNPLGLFPYLQNAVSEGAIQVFFWAEPFGLADFWSLYPGQVLVSFSDPGWVYENFLSLAEDVAARTKALADPTRLIILRLVRNFSMDNTEIAEYLNLARPTVSIHAKVLREAGLIRTQPDGRSVRHEIVAEELQRLFQDLERFLDLNKPLRS